MTGQSPTPAVRKSPKNSPVYLLSVNVEVCKGKNALMPFISYVLLAKEWFSVFFFIEWKEIYEPHFLC